MKTLYANGTVWTGRETVENCYVVTTDEYITYVGAARPEGKFDAVENMSGRIMLPGLVNAHTHSPMTLLRGVGSGLPLREWLFDKVCPVEAKLTEEDIRAGSMLALMEMIASGTVSFTDMYFRPAATARAAGEAGMKANLTVPVQAFSEDVDPDNAADVAELLALWDEYDGAFGGRLKVDFCVHAEYTCTERVASRVANLAKERGAGFHTHVSETASEHAECVARRGMTPAAWFESVGAFDGRVSAAHCVHLTDADAEIMKKRSVSVIHNPSSNMKLASGFAPVRKFVDAGINVALGTDGAASNNNLNMFEEMHLAALIASGYTGDPTCLQAADVLRMASANGALAQGRTDCGYIAEGMRADFTAISADAPHMFPVLDVPALLVYSAQASDVCLTVVDGRILYKNGVFRTIDAERVFYDCRRAAERLY